MTYNCDCQGSPALRPAKIPVVASVRAANSWLLVTTDRLILFGDGGLFSAEGSDLKDATVELAPNQEQGTLTKANVSRLRIELFSGADRVVDVEPGLTQLVL